MIKKSLRQKIYNERPHFCTGCGSSQNLSLSHLIPVSKRKDLENCEENIVFHCLSIGKRGCHECHESNNYWQMSALNDFEQNMKTIKKLDRQHWEFLLSRFRNQPQGYDNKPLKFVENEEKHR